MIEVSEETISKIHTILAGVKDADKKVLKPALGRGLSAGKTAISKGVRETYRVTPSVFSNYAKIGLKGVELSGNEIVGSITYSGGVIPLYKFNVTPKKPTYGKKQVNASVMRMGSQVVFENAFTAQMKNGHLGVFERKGIWKMSTRNNSKKETPNNEHTEKMKELFGPSVPKMIENANVMKTAEERVNEVINQRIDHEIERLLNR